MVMLVIGSCGLGGGGRVFGDFLVDALWRVFFGWVVRHFFRTLVVRWGWILNLMDFFGSRISKIVRC